MMFPVIQEKNLEINSAARAGSTPQWKGHPGDDIKTIFNYRNFSFKNLLKNLQKNFIYKSTPMGSNLYHNLMYENDMF